MGNINTFMDLNPQHNENHTKENTKKKAEEEIKFAKNIQKLNVLSFEGNVTRLHNFIALHFISYLQNVILKTKKICLPWSTS